MKTEQEIVLQKKMIIIFSLALLTIIIGILNIQKEKVSLAAESETYDDSIIKVYNVYTAREELFKIEVSGEACTNTNVEEFQSGEEVKDNTNIEKNSVEIKEISEEENKVSSSKEKIKTEKVVKKELHEETVSQEINVVEEKQDVSSEESGEVNQTTELVTSRGSYIRDTGVPPTEYESVIKVKATAYCLCKKCCGKSPSNPRYGYTASGLRIVPGTGMKVIAVDTSVVPLGTNVYVEGLNGAKNYGYAVAADTGSAIKNNKIDLYMDTHSQALAWGVKYVNLYILGE